MIRSARPLHSLRAGMLTHRLYSQADKLQLFSQQRKTGKLNTKNPPSLSSSQINFRNKADLASQIETWCYSYFLVAISSKNTTKLLIVVNFC